MLGTYWEPGRKTKNNFPPHPTHKRKRQPHVHVERSHWLYEISLSKTVGHHFWPGLMAGVEF